MRGELFAKRTLNFAAGFCLLVYFVTNLAFVLLDYVNPFSFALVTLPFKALFSFTGFFAVLGSVATKVSSYYLEERDHGAWIHILVALVVLIAVFLLAPIRLPAQWWLYVTGTVTYMVAIFALAAALLAIGPVIIRFLGSVVMLGALAFTGVGLLGFSNYSFVDQTLKRGNITTPQAAFRALGSASSSVAIENGTNGYLPTERGCRNSDAVCTGDVEMYEISEIKQALGLLEADWQKISGNVDLYQVQHRNLYLTLAQGYGETYVTVADLAKVPESEWSEVRISVPSAEN